MGESTGVDNQEGGVWKRFIEKILFELSFERRVGVCLPGRRSSGKAAEISWHFFKELQVLQFYRV